MGTLDSARVPKGKPPQSIEHTFAHQPPNLIPITPHPRAGSAWAERVVARTLDGSTRAVIPMYTPVRRCTLAVMSTVSVSEARAALPEILNRVIAGEEVTITRHGREVAVIVRPDAMRVRRADQALAEADRLRDLLDRGRGARLSDAPVLSAERADELVAEVAASRSAR